MSSGVVRNSTFQNCKEHCENDDHRISNAVFEAVAGGLPVVSTDCDSMREAVTETRPTLGFIGNHSLLRMHWGHEPLRLTEAPSGPRVCDLQPARFMERRSLQNLDANRGHER